MDIRYERWTAKLTAALRYTYSYIKETCPPLAAIFVSFCTYDNTVRYELDKHTDDFGRHTKVQVPLLTTTTKLLRSGVSSGRGSHASSTTVGSVLVANTGKVPFTGSGNVSKYGMGSCAAPCTVAFCSGMTVLSRLATEIAAIAFPGPDVYQDPFEPSLPV